MIATSVSSSPPTTEPLRTRPSANVTITLLAPSITWCVVRTCPCASRRTPEPNPRRGHGRPNGGPYGAPAVLTLTVLTPTRSTALTYAFCKSAIMETGTRPRGLLSEFWQGRSQSRSATKDTSVDACPQYVAWREQGVRDDTEDRKHSSDEDRERRNHEGEKDPYDQNGWNASSSSLHNRPST